MSIVYFGYGTQLYSRVAYELLGWALQEKNRVKASRVYRVACRIENRKREYLNEVTHSNLRPFTGVPQEEVMS